MRRTTRAANPNSHQTSYDYDELGRLLTETDPLGKATSFAYDATGALESKTDAKGQTTSYARDALNRLTGASYPDGSGIQATYDAVGNLTSATDPSGGTTSYEYDQRNRPVQETLPDDGTLKRQYDAAGRRTSLTDPKGKKTSYEYDAANRLTSVTDPKGETSYSYDDDRPLGVAYPNGAGQTLAYDALGRAASATAAGPGGSVLSKLSYAYDKNSNPTSISDQAGNQSTFAYDALDRLTQEAHPQKGLSYTYDAAGNRKGMAEGSSTTTNYTYDAAERMTGAGSETFSYDSNGNMTSRSSDSESTQYSYDSRDRLIGAGGKTYERDAFGRAVSSTDEGGTKTDYLFDGGQVIQEKAAGGESVDYARGLAGRLISLRRGTSSPSYYHHDSVGSVVGLSGGSGTMSDTYSYDAFGNELSRTGQSDQPYRYLGNRYESSSGLLDFHVRAYDPKAGRASPQRTRSRGWRPSLRA